MFDIHVRIKDNFEVNIRNGKTELNEDKNEIGDRELYFIVNAEFLDTIDKFVKFSCRYEGLLSFTCFQCQNDL